MAYANFIPTVWNAGIDRELERLCVFAEDCNRRYEGAVQNKGEAVTILGVGKPTIKTMERAAANGVIDGAEEVEDTSVLLYVNQIRYFNYMVGDIDRAQAVDGVLDALNRETSEGLSGEIDRYIANLATDPCVPKLYTSAQKVVASDTPGTDEKNVLTVLDDAIEQLYENDVPPTANIVVTVSPRFYALFRRAYMKADTANSGILENGRVGKYGNVQVKMSNNVCRTDDGATDNIMIRTQRAVAFVKPRTHTEAYRPENKFADAVKGYVLFDAKVVRPREIININVKYA